MRLLAFVIAVVSCSALAHDYQAGDRIVMNYDLVESTGMDLLRDLANLADYDNPPIAEGSEAEDDLADKIDEILFDVSEELFRYPVEEVVSEAKDEIFTEFLKVVGAKAFAKGATPAQFLNLIDRVVRPKGCQSYLLINVHSSKASRFDH